MTLPEKCSNFLKKIKDHRFVNTLDTALDKWCSTVHVLPWQNIPWIMVRCLVIRKLLEENRTLNKTYFGLFFQKCKIGELYTGKNPGSSFRKLKKKNPLIFLEIQFFVLPFFILTVRRHLLCVMRKPLSYLPTFTFWPVDRIPNTKQ